MMSLAWLYLRRVPGIAWVILLVAALLGVSAFALYRRGEVVGATKVHRVALADSVHVTRAKVDTAAAQSDSLIREAHRAVARSNGGREATRAVLAAADSTIPHSVIQAIDEQFARDSTTIAVQTSTIAELTTERGLRIQLDTLQQHQVDFTPPGDGISVTDVVVTVGIVATVVEAVRLVLQLLRH